MIPVLETIWDYWKSGGPLLLPITAVGIAIIYQWRRLDAGFNLALHEAEVVGRQLGKNETDAVPGECEAAACCCGANVLEEEVRTALKGLRAKTDVRTIVDTILCTRRASLEEQIHVLAALTAVAPLLGLLGTVTGMTSTFAVTASAIADPARQVADGISVALLTTQYGLIAALPGLFGLVRIERLRARLQCCDGTIGMLACTVCMRESIYV